MEMNFLHYTATHSWSSPALFIDPEQTQRKLALPYRRMKPTGSKYCITGGCKIYLATPTDGLCKLHNHTITFTAIDEQNRS